MAGQQIRFDLDFDHGAWPGILGGAGGEGERTAISGAAWLGPAGLLGLLETHLGLRGPSVPGSERVATLVPAVRSTSGFWSESAAADPFATARRLLADRDLLRLNGWRGDAVTHPGKGHSSG